MLPLVTVGYSVQQYVTTGYNRNFRISYNVLHWLTARALLGQV